VLKFTGADFAILPRRGQVLDSMRNFNSLLTADRSGGAQGHGRAYF